MNDSSSPPVLYLGDNDDDDNNEHNNYFESNMLLPRASSSSNEMNLPRKKRKLSNANVRVNPSVVNWSKRQRNNHYQERLTQNMIDSDLDSEPILLDPNEYIIEEPDSHSYCSFDWTIQSQPSSSLISTKISSNSSRISNSNVNNVLKRPIDKPDSILVTNTNGKFIQSQQKPSFIPPARPSLALLSLPLPKPTASIAQTNIQRSRPMKNSRIPNTQSTSTPLPIRQRPEQQIFATKQPISRPPPPPPPLSSASTVSTSSSNNLTPEIRRQVLNGTGIFSAFHDSKYYRCNICKFKSVTSSTLLQHLFTHMFFCDQCSFYTYSYYNLSQHMFDKHHLNLIEEITEPLNPTSFELLYVTRCPDGTFALCMDTLSTPSTTTTTNKITNNDQQLIISSATLTDQHRSKSPKKKLLKQKKFPQEDDNDIVVLSEKHDIHPQLSIQSKSKEKIHQTYVLMKHRRCFIKKKFCLHSLILEYNICREHTIRHMSHTQNILQRRKFLTKFSQTRLIDEVANCLKIIVNKIVNYEEEEEEENRFNQSSLICLLSNQILSSILNIKNLNLITNLLKLNNKYDQSIEQNQLYNNEKLLRENHEHIYILSSADTNQPEQGIISSLHSSLTNGDSIFTQAKVDKVSTIYDNTHRYLKGNLNTQSSKVQKKQPLSKQVSLRPIISKPSRSLSTRIVDKNNNSISSSTTTPNVIVLD